MKSGDVIRVMVIEEHTNMQQKNLTIFCRLLVLKTFFFIFSILLTVHLGPVLVNNQLDAVFFSVFIYFTSLHVSSNPVLIIRRIELYQYIIWYISLCVGDCMVCRSGRTGIPGSHLHRVTYTR